ncbi:hypothetical protein vBRpoSV10_171 [Ruegeria phage vB_RpoS-V10]|nr:hypothetical protein vBRpoSV10_171 [Ruegeria phage vB_RpoS-V10]
MAVRVDVIVTLEGAHHHFDDVTTVGVDDKMVIVHHTTAGGKKEIVRFPMDRVIMVRESRYVV